jgi:hypothetical protein
MLIGVVKEKSILPWTGVAPSIIEEIEEVEEVEEVEGEGSINHVSKADKLNLVENIARIIDDFFVFSIVDKLNCSGALNNSP